MKTRSHRQRLRHLAEAAAVWPLRTTLRLMPLDAASLCAGWFGRQLANAVFEQRTAEHNVALGLPELPTVERKQIARDHAINFSRAIVECLHLSTLANEADARMNLHGADYLDQFEKPATGIVFVSAHIGNPEACRIAIGEFTGRPVPALVYALPKNPHIVDVAESAVRMLGAPIFPRSPTLGRRLRDHVAGGGDVFALADQHTRRGALIPFLGVPAQTPTGLASLCRHTGAPMVPIFAVRRPGVVVAFDVYIEPPIAVTDSVGMMAELNQRFDQRIRATPEQWLWSHNRWAGTQFAPLGKTR